MAVPMGRHGIAAAPRREYRPGLLTGKVGISRDVDVSLDDQRVRVDLETRAGDPHLEEVLLLVTEPVRGLEQRLLSVSI